MSRAYVGNLPENISQDELLAFFETVGRVGEVQIKRTVSLDWYAFVHYEDPDGAGRAVAKLDNVHFQGRRLRVELPFTSKPRRDFTSDSREISGRRPRGPPRPGTAFRVQVTGLPQSGSWQDLKDHFREIGDCLFADVFGDGTGVVEFGSSSAAVRAIDRLQGSSLRSHQGDQNKISLRMTRESSVDITDHRDGDDRLGPVSGGPYSSGPRGGMGGGPSDQPGCRGPPVDGYRRRGDGGDGDGDRYRRGDGGGDGDGGGYHGERAPRRSNNYDDGAGWNGRNDCYFQRGGHRVSQVGGGESRPYRRDGDGGGGYRREGGPASSSSVSQYGKRSFDNNNGGHDGGGYGSGDGDGRRDGGHRFLSGGGDREFGGHSGPSSSSRAGRSSEGYYGPIRGGERESSSSYRGSGRYGDGDMDQAQSQRGLPPMSGGSVSTETAAAYSLGRPSTESMPGSDEVIVRDHHHHHHQLSSGEKGGHANGREDESATTTTEGRAGIVVRD